MYFLRSPSRHPVCWNGQAAWLAPRHVRCMSLAAAARRAKKTLPPQETAETPAQSFRELGLDDSFVRSLHKAFPNVLAPTSIQSQLIPEVLGQKDVLLKDVTGSGKSFGLLVGLLNKPRFVSQEPTEDGGTSERRFITSLFVVPHRDLAFQFLRWTERLVAALDDPPELSSVAQILVRGEGRSVSEMVAQLKETPPHVLICTPQALMEVYKADKEALGLDTLSTVAVDEVDYLVETVARKDPNKSYRKAFEQAQKKLMKHPGPTREFLNQVYAKRVEAARAARSALEEDEDDMVEVVAHTEAEDLPQLILSSATLRVHLKNFVFEESGWLNKGNHVKIFSEKRSTRRLGVTHELTGAVLHSVLVVDGSDVQNVCEAVKAPGNLAGSIVGPEEELPLEDEAQEEYFDAKSYGKKGALDPTSLETVATAFAMDVPSTALVVVPPGVSVTQTVAELIALGVDAHPLDLRTEPRGLLVGTAATTRGVDVPGLSHVFIVGLPGTSVRGRTVDTYLHLAGRTGRFGGAGRVISLVNQADAPKLVRLLRSISIRPVLFEQFY